jgi:hypothetical protein
MKILIVIIILVVSLLVLLLILGLFMKKEYKVGREVVIKKPKALVFDFIKLLKNQNSYSVWAAIDPNMRKEFRGIDGTTGFVSSWESNNKNVGKGEQEILSIIEGEEINYVIRFIKPFESTSYASMCVSAIADIQTRVQWVFTGNMKYPMNLMLLFMNMEKMIGRDLQTGLANLNELMKK